MKFTLLTFVVVLIWANKNISGATNGPSESRNENDLKKTRDKIILGEDIQSTNHEHSSHWEEYRLYNFPILQKQ